MSKTCSRETGMIVGTCATCRWRSVLPYVNPDRGTAEFGEAMYACKRRSPVVTGGMHCPTMTIWPTVARTDWCGEFQSATDDAGEV